MQRMNEIRRTYESPYKQQAAAQGPTLPQTQSMYVSMYESTGKNFLQINRERIQSIAE